MYSLDNYQSEQSAEYFTDLLKILKLPSKNVSVTGFAVNSAFQVTGAAGATVTYADIGGILPTIIPIGSITLSNPRRILFGNITFSCTPVVYAGVGDVTIQLYFADRNGPSVVIPTLPILLTTFNAATTRIDGLQTFNEIKMDLLEVIATGAAGIVAYDYRISYKFNGLIINYY